MPEIDFSQLRSYLKLPRLSGKRKHSPRERHQTPAGSTDGTKREGAVYRDVVTHSLGADFRLCTEIAQRYWEVNASHNADEFIFVDLMVQDLRVAIRNLTMANGIRRTTPATLIGIVGADPEWEHAVWDYHDESAVRRLAEAYGVHHFVSLGTLAEEVRQGKSPEVTIGDRHVRITKEHGLPASYIEGEAVSSALRILRFPRDGRKLRELPESTGIIERTVCFAAVWHSLMSALRPQAIIVAHVDYSAWGTGVCEAMSLNIPVIHVQSTGSMKAYAWFPENATTGSFREQMTRSIAHQFETDIWPQRDLLRRPAEMVASRVKSDVGGRPSWWRTGGSLTIVNEEERTAVRQTATGQLGIDAEKPIIAVFAHAQSDALGSNIEVFTDFVDWLESTAEFAARHDEVSWLFLDHPSQFRYDHTDFFGELAQRYVLPHMVFRPSLDIRKNALWSMVDLAVTVRGSVSAEFPTFGVPAIQAGWSEWSHLQFTMRADSREEYFDSLSSSISSLAARERLVTPEAVERARLWQWFYRSGADVASPIVPPWAFPPGEVTFHTLHVGMNNVESDADPVLQAIRRLWVRREPILTRADFTNNLEAQLAGVTSSRDMSIPDYPLRTRFDSDHPPLEGSVVIDSGKTPSLVQADGVLLGVTVIGRMTATHASIAFAYQGDWSQDHVITLQMQVDGRTNKWWVDRAPGPAKRETPPQHRHIVVYCQEKPVSYCTLPPSKNGVATAEATFVVSAPQMDGADLISFSIVGVVPRGRRSTDSTTTILSGVQINSVSIAPITTDEAPVEQDIEELSDQGFLVRDGSKSGLLLDPVSS